MPVAARAQSSPFVADPDRAEGTLVRLDGEDLMVDLPGASVDEICGLFRPVSVRHPVSGRALRDRFPIGRARVTVPGAVLSLARPEGATDRRPEVGDILVCQARARQEPAPQADGTPRSLREELEEVVRSGRPQPSATPRPSGAHAQAALPPIVSPDFVQAPGSNPQERMVTALWLRTLGTTPEVRIVQYRDFLLANPATPFRAQITREILALGTLSARVQGSVPEPQEPRVRPVAPPEVEGDAPPEADPARLLRVGDPAVVALQLSPESPYRSAILNVRRDDEEHYRQLPLRVEPHGYLRARIPERYVEPPGFAYFVELVDPRGRAMPALWSADAPLHVQVESPGHSASSIHGRSRIDLRTEYADVGSGTFEGKYRNEWFLLTEGDFFQRVRVGVLYGYRVGFGMYSGEGQPLEAYEPGAEIDQRNANVVYGYHELELEVSPLVHTMLRIEVGIHDQGLVGGGQARLRIGDEQKTNIILGGDVMDEVGQKAFFAFTFFPVERLPVLAQGEVFNQIIDGGDPMFRLVTQVGYRFERWVSMALRGSYQLRNIAHGGFGGGAAVTLDW